MRTPLSLRIARLLLFAAGASAVGLAAYIAAQSRGPLAASPWLALLLLNAVGFFGATLLLEPRPARARLIAVASALALGVLGTITGFGAGMLSFPAAGIGALAAWAAVLTPPRRPLVIAFLLYMAIGIATLGPTLFYPLLLPTVFIWPLRLLLFTAFSVVPMYLLLGVAAGIGLLAMTDRRAFRPRPTAGTWALVAGISVAAGAAAAVLFQAVALAREDTSARFELDPLVLAAVFIGAASAAAGAALMRIAPGAAAAFALGLGAAALFMTFTYRPAVTCSPNSTAQGLPLAWALRAPFEQQRGMSSSGGTQSTRANVGGDTTSTGRFQSGDREAVFRCEGGRVVEYREVSR
jgi:hypothetical protein